MVHRWRTNQSFGQGSEQYFANTGRAVLQTVLKRSLEDAMGGGTEFEALHVPRTQLLK